ncbi:histidine phosphatase family protein [Aeromicrobium fastidiosum]|uniref:histidine phosphatase family protein n=1 Tax=Aeromicrobium fastidiosum TaxID=52699 RepID=UPI00202363F5|nr:histidine phosphatase family protein [Aeromicrobium fastidiosum]MCL8252983.1 histidine phosphatase family protein [Aeromicrobium fastidiosum]
MGSIHLIRHGQASFGAADYDQLSELGYEQSSSLGVSWEASGWAPTSAVAGGMKRHAQTAIAAIDASGEGDGYDVDPGWDEYDHLALAKAQDSSAMGSDTKAFQRTLNIAITGWMAGEPGPGEPYETFRSRVMASFDDVVAQATSGRQVAVFTSGGPIALVASHLLAGDDSLFQRINDVIVNASVTTVIVGASGARLLAFNETGHLPRDMVTFR